MPGRIFCSNKLVSGQAGMLCLEWLPRTRCVLTGRPVCSIQEELVDMLRLLSTGDEGVAVIPALAEGTHDALPTAPSDLSDSGKANRKNPSLSGTLCSFVHVQSGVVQYSPA